MDVSKINDADYIAYLSPGIFRNRYLKWKERTIPKMDAILEALDAKPLSEVQSEFGLTDNDVGMMVRLNYVDADVAERTGMAEIEKRIPK